MKTFPKDTVEQGEFDYVIVGAGTAGSLLANRLAADGKSTVCLLEAGPPDNHPYIHIPGAFIKTLFNPKYTWQFETEPSEGSGGRKIPVTQGKTLGGSSSINGMVYNRGIAADYDQWAQMGNSGWSYEDVLPFFKKIELRIGNGDDRYRGRDGDVVVTDLDWIHPLCNAFIDGAVGLGIPRNADYNGAEHAGVSYVQRSIYRGLRQNTARAFLRPVRNKKNLEIKTNTRAIGIAVAGKQASGVRYINDGYGGVVNFVRALKEVIVCGGSVNSAKLLQLSGIGNAQYLTKLGVEINHDLPGVGEGLRDHFAARVVYGVKKMKTINELSRGLPLLGQIGRWMFGKPSILGLSPAMINIFWKSDESMPGEDLHGAFAPASYREGFVAQLDTYPGMTCGFYQQRPESVGYVRIRSADPFEEPAIQPNYLAHPLDQRVMIAGIRLARRLLNVPELAPYRETERLPGTDAKTDEDLLTFAKRYGGTAYHLIGTCRMGPEKDKYAVLDQRLRVHGLASLRVVDASIMPNMPSGNTAIPTLMIAEKAASMIKMDDKHGADDHCLSGVLCRQRS